MALNDDRLKGDLRLRWYENGSFTFDLPSDPMVAYAMLQVAKDEIQERMMGVKAAHQRKQQMSLIPADGQAKQPKWGT